MNAYQRRHVRFLVKQTIKYTVATIIFTTLLFSAFDYGQSKVDRWEAETGRYGEGLR